MKFGLNRKKKKSDFFKDIIPDHHFLVLGFHIVSTFERHTADKEYNCNDE